MKKRKIAILGGGMAGLSAAWELTRTPQLANENQVTVFQLGWRLGGKGASGRKAPTPGNPHPDDRVLEHGLHIWFGCYDNAFRMLKEAYAEWQKPAACPLVSWRDAFEAQNRTLFGYDTADGRRGYHAITFKSNSREPGTGDVGNSLWDLAVSLYELARDVLKEDDRLLREGASLTTALLRGVLVDCYEQKRSLDALDVEDFSAWLARHGCDLTVGTSTLLKTLHDTFFWYGEGDPARPSVGAGTAITVILRAMCTYKEAITFKMTAGMGEVVVAPMYDVLRSRNVRFEFFRKVTRLELERQTLRRVHLARQADTIDGRAYAPTFEKDGLVCWPSEPLWEQLKDGPALRDRGVNFESHWETHCAGSEVLEVDETADPNGDKFTHVILAVSLGAFKKLNDDPSMCDELFDASPAFREMAASIDLVPSRAAQIWCMRKTADLTDYPAGYQSVAGPAPQTIWADMSQVLSSERHPAPGPQSLHYSCGTFKTELHKQPLSAQGTEQRALDVVREDLTHWLSHCSSALWQRANIGGRFDWNILHDPENRAGVARLEAQYLRANVTPSECCPGTPPGSSQRRLRSDQSGFKNLFLAGCYVRTGLNTTSVEGAVMSGMQASRAICGSPRIVVGEDFGKIVGRAPAPAPSTTGRGLPTYVSQLGMGQMSHEAPLLVSDIELHAFRLSGQRSLMQQLVDQNLNLPSMRAGSPVRFTVLGNSALLAFLFSSAAGPSAPDNRVGVMDDREAALFIPLLQRNGLQLKLTAWVPYLFIDRPIGMTMGREVWGYTKSAAEIQWPHALGSGGDYVVRTSTLKVHAPGSVARDEQILRLHRTQRPPVAHESNSTWNGFRDVIGAMLPEAVLLRLLQGRSLGVVNLKQFRDAENSKLACYQALVESPMELGENFRAGKLDTTGMKLDVLTCDSHQLVKQFGFAERVGEDVTTLDVKQGVWAKMSFTAQHGHVLWKLP